MARHGLGLILTALLLAASLSGCGADTDATVAETSTEQVRPFAATNGDRWTGNAVCYGPHRDGQRPGGPDPAAAELREDLDLIVRHWNLMRIYGATGVAADILKVIHDDGLDLKVMLGAWIAADDSVANAAEVAAAIRLADAYPEVVVAVCVGNETQVFWSAHRSPLDDLITHVRHVRGKVQVPVTVADDYNFWNKPESRALARELDFLTVHAHPMWNGLQLADALPWVEAQLDSVQSLHPDRGLVLGETGWATTVHDQGEQAELIKGRPGEAEQKIYYDAVRAWADVTRQTVFFFEAFDENWKGGSHPNEVEKHWGVYRADRTPKLATTP